MSVFLLAAILSSGEAHAVTGVYGTSSLVVALGPVADHARFGFAIEGGAQMFWHEAPYWSDGPRHFAPLGTVAMHLAWTRPVTSLQLTAVGGLMYPLMLGDIGFVPLFGAQAGVGLGLATDGAVGPVFVGQVVSPFTEGRFDTILWRGALHAPRVSVGTSIENCCGYLF